MRPACSSASEAAPMSRNVRRAGGRWAGALVALLLAAAPAGAADYALRTLARVGEPAPTEGTFDMLSGFDASRIGHVAFWGSHRIGVGDPTGAIYVHDGVAAWRAVEQGDLAPGGPGLTYLALGSASLNDAGELAFFALRSDGLQLLVARSAQGDRVVALEGQPAPGPAGATWDSFAARLQLGDEGDLLFYAVLDTPTGPRQGWFLESGGGVSSVYLEGDPAPAAVGGTYASVTTLDAALSDGGRVHFVADLAGSTVPSALLRYEAAVVTPVLLEGDPVATPRGGSWGGFILVAASGSGKVAVRGLVVDRQPLPFPLGLALVFDGGDLDEIAASHDPIPGTGQAFLREAFQIAPNDSGDVSMVGLMQDDDGLSRSVLLATRQGSLRPVVFEADSPNASDDIGFLQIWDSQIDAVGRIAFSSSVAGGSGIFLATPVDAVPAVGPLGLLLLWTGLIAAAPLARARRAPEQPGRHPRTPSGPQRP
jgi:hypothetical protein